jgi:hypothetical protein
VSKPKIVYCAYWRKPKPQCNWCPRIEIAYSAKSGRVVGIMRNNRGALYHTLRQKLDLTTGEILETWSELELTPGAFNNLNRDIAADFHINGRDCL